MPTAGLSDVVRFGRLRHRVDQQVVPYTPTLFDDELLTAVDAAILHWVPLAVVLPIPATATAVTLGAAATVNVIGRTKRFDGVVAVVSRQLSHRALYDTLYLEEQRLREFVPRARLSGDGHVVPVGRPRHDSGGRLLLTTDLARLAHVEDLAAVVLDATAVPARSLPSLLHLPAGGTPLIYLTGNPLDTALGALRAAGGVVWSWDLDDLPPLAAPLPPVILPGDRARPASPRATAGRADGTALHDGTLAAPAGLLRASGHTRRAIWLPDDATTGRSRTGGRPPAAAADDRALDDALAGLWRAIGALTAAYRPTSPATTLTRALPATGTIDRSQPALSAADLALRWVWALFNTLSLLPVDPARYDLLLPASPWATRLTSSPEQARAYVRHTPTHLTEPWLRVAAALEHLLHAAAPAPKLSRVLTWVRAVATDPTGDPLRATSDPDRLSEHSSPPRGTRGADALDAPSGPGLLVTRNRSAAAALTQVLDEHPDIPLGWAERVAVVTINDVLTGRVRTASHLLLCGAVPRSAAGLLAMPATRTVTVLAAGPWEGTRQTRQLQAACAALRGLRTETVTLTAPRLQIAPHRTDLFGADPDLVAVADGHTRPLPAHPDAPGWEPFDADLAGLLARLSSTVRDDLPPPPVQAGDVTVAAIAVWLADGAPAAGPAAALLVRPEDLVHRRRGTTLAQVAAKSLAAGDVLMLVDTDARADLFATLTTRLAELPEFAPLIMLIDFWRARAAAARDLDLSHEQILRRMIGGGSAITSPDTVASWIRGRVYGPADPDDVARFADAVGDRELAARAVPVGRAVQALQATHRKIGQWLSGQIGGAIDRTDPEQLVDAQLELHVADLLDSITLHPVVGVDLAVRTMPAALTAAVLDAASASAYGFRPPACG